jgi:hypothetical protein
VGNKTIASGTSSGTQKHAYTLAREVLFKPATLGLTPGDLAL